MIRALLIEGEQRREISWPAGKEAWEGTDAILWLEVQGQQPEEIEALGAEFNLHPAIVRACSHPEHRAKLKEYRGFVLLVLNAVSRVLSPGGSRLDLRRWRTLELNVVIGPRLVITVHPDEISAVALLFQRYLAGEGRPSTDYLLYNICDSVTSGYYAVLDRIDVLIDELENAIFAGNVGPPVVNRLFALKRHILYIRRVLGPQRDALGVLMRREFAVISPDFRSYYLDVFEHSLRLFDMLDTYRDLISSSLDAYLSMISQRTNEIMKTLTIVSTIMLPLTLITGIFGMNVGGLPFEAPAWGFWAVMGIMLVLGALMTAYFRRRGWF